MFAAFFKAFAQLSDPPLMRVVLKAVLGAALVYVLLIAGLAWLLAQAWVRDLPLFVASGKFYGGGPAVEDVPKIKAPMQVHLAGEDARVNGGWPPVKAALEAAGVRHEIHTYEGAQHGFHNDTTPRYDEAAAKLAWQRTLAHFNKYLKG